MPRREGAWAAQDKGRRRTRRRKTQTLGKRRTWQREPRGRRCLRLPASRGRGVEGAGPICRERRPSSDPAECSTWGQPLPRGVLGGVVLGARTRCCSHLGRPAIPSPAHQQVLTSRCWPPTPASLDSRPRSPSPLGAPSLSLLAGRPFPVTLWQTSSTALCLSWDPSFLLLFELFHHVLFFLKK